MRKSTICVVAAAAFLQSCTSITFRKVNESEMNDLANFPNNPVASKKSTYLKKDLPVDPQNHITAVGSFREGFFHYPRNTSWNNRTLLPPCTTFKHLQPPSSTFYHLLPP